MPNTIFVSYYFAVSLYIFLLTSTILHHPSYIILLTSSFNFFPNLPIQFNSPLR